MALKIKNTYPLQKTKPNPAPTSKPNPTWGLDISLFMEVLTWGPGDGEESVPVLNVIPDLSGTRILTSFLTCPCLLLGTGTLGSRNRKLKEKLFEKHMELKGKTKLTLTKKTWRKNKLTTAKETDGGT